MIESTSVCKEECDSCHKVRTVLQINGQYDTIIYLCSICLEEFVGSLVRADENRGPR